MILSMSIILALRTWGRRIRSWGSSLTTKRIWSQYRIYQKCIVKLLSPSFPKIASVFVSDRHKNLESFPILPQHTQASRPSLLTLFLKFWGHTVLISSLPFSAHFFLNQVHAPFPINYPYSPTNKLSEIQPVSYFCIPNPHIKISLKLLLKTAKVFVHLDLTEIGLLISNQSFSSF